MCQGSYRYIDSRPYKIKVQDYTATTCVKLEHRNKEGRLRKRSQDQDCGGEPVEENGAGMDQDVQVQRQVCGEVGS